MQEHAARHDKMNQKHVDHWKTANGTAFPQSKSNVLDNDLTTTESVTKMPSSRLSFCDVAEKFWEPTKASRPSDKNHFRMDIERRFRRIRPIVHASGGKLLKCRISIHVHQSCRREPKRRGLRQQLGRS